MTFKSFETSYLDCVWHELSKSIGKINDKIRRTICSAPKTKVRLSKNLARVVLCCPNCPVKGNQFQRESKYCERHQNLEQERLGEPSTKKSKLTEESSSSSSQGNIVLTINLKQMTSSTHFDQHLQDVGDAEESNGCDLPTLPGCKKVRSRNSMTQRRAYLPSSGRVALYVPFARCWPKKVTRSFWLSWYASCTGMKL